MMRATDEKVLRAIKSYSKFEVTCNLWTLWTFTPLSHNQNNQKLWLLLNFEFFFWGETLPLSGLQVEILQFVKWFEFKD